MNSVEIKVVENWEKPEVFRTLKEKDLISDKEVVFESFKLRGEGTSLIHTLQRVKPGIVKVKKYYFESGKLSSNAGVDYWTNSLDIGYNPEAKSDQILYDAEDKFLREAGL